MDSAADRSAPAQLLLERFPPELTDTKGKAVIQTVCDSIDQLIVQDLKGEIRADEAVFRMGGDAVAMRDAFLAAYGRPIADGIVDADSDEMTQQLRAALRSTQPRPAVSGNEFVLCLQRRLVIWVVIIVINVQALLGILTGVVTESL